MATLAQQQQFVATYGPYATQAGSQLGVNPTIILGQWAQESGWGTSSVAQNYGNLAGINVAGSTTGTNYASYSSPQDFTNAYISTLQNPRYASALNTGTDANAFVSGLKSGGYFSGDQGVYESNVASNANTIASINPSLATSDMTVADGTSTTTEGYGSSIDVGGTTPGTTYDPSAPAGTFGSETVPTTTTGGAVATGVGTPVDVGLQTGTQQTIAGVGTTIGNSITGVGTTLQKFFGGLLGSLENWFSRGFLIVIGLVILAIALWRVLDPSGEKTAQFVKAAPEAAV